jgi:hypothetical protein
VETTRSLKRKNLSKEDQDDLDALDRAFKRIKSVAPPTPYILSTPSLYPYTYHSQQEANAWMMGRLWRHDEEHLQYRTYVFREPCQDCLELQAGEDDGPQPERPESRASNNGGQTTKRKLNLSAFKVKQANGTITPGSKKISPNLPPTKVTQAQANGIKKPEEQAAVDQKPDTKSDKRYDAPQPRPCFVLIRRQIFPRSTQRGWSIQEQQQHFRSRLTGTPPLALAQSRHRRHQSQR